MRPFLKRVLLFMALLALTSSSLAFLAVEKLPASGLAMRMIPGYPDNFLFNNLGWRYYHITKREVAELGSIKDLDIFFLGSSHFFRAYDPRFMARHGYRTFNLCTPSQTPFHSFYLLRQYRDLVEPRLVVVDVIGVLIDYRRAEATLDLTRHVPLSANLLEMAAYSGDSRAWRSVWLKLHDPEAWSPPRPPREAATADFEGTKERGGYVPGGFLESEAVWDGRVREADPRMVLSPFQMDYLQDIIRWCRDRNQPLLLASTPVSPEFRSAVPAMGQLAAQVRELAAAEGVEYLDFSDDPGFESPRHFRDSHHLNSAGVGVFLPLFLEALAERKAALKSGGTGRSARRLNVVMIRSTEAPSEMWSMPLPASASVAP